MPGAVGRRPGGVKDAVLRDQLQRRVQVVGAPGLAEGCDYFQSRRIYGESHTMMLAQEPVGVNGR